MTVDAAAQMQPQPVPMHFQMPMRPPDGAHPTGFHQDQFVVLRRSVLPQVRVRCARDDKCCKENGHRGRCSLQLKPKEDDMLRLVEQMRMLEAELQDTKGERDRLKEESAKLWGKLMQVRAPAGRAGCASCRLRPPASLRAPLRAHAARRGALAPRRA